jgi:hypothetical protein
MGTKKIHLTLLLIFCFYTVNIFSINTTEAKKTLDALNIDGVLSESTWSVTNSVTKSIIGTNNNTVTFGVLWDASYIYVGVKVLDANLYSNGPNPWDNDCVEIYIDGGFNKATTYDANDFQILQQYNSSSIWCGKTVNGVLSGWTAISGGYTVEMAIPWTTIGVTPVAGSKIGFDIANDDNDAGSGRTGQLIWNGDGSSWQSAANFGELTLSTQVVGTIINVSGVGVSSERDTIAVSGTKKLDVTITPSNASIKDVTWTSSDNTVASVSPSGLVTALKAGATVITATTVNGNFKATSTIVVLTTPNVINGSSIKFSADGFIDASSSISKMTLSKGFTISGWFNMTGDGTIFALTDSNNVDLVAGGLWSIWKNELPSNDWGITYASRYLGYNTNQWYFVAFTVDASGMSKIYINGCLENQVACVSFLPKKLAKIGIGGNQNLVSNGIHPLYRGSIENVSIWNKVLTSNELKNIIINELTGSETNLIAYYKLNETSGNTAYDGTSGKNNASITGISYTRKNPGYTISASKPSKPINLIAKAAANTINLNISMPAENLSGIMYKIFSDNKVIDTVSVNYPIISHLPDNASFTIGVSALNIKSGLESDVTTISCRTLAASKVNKTNFIIDNTSTIENIWKFQPSNSIKNFVTGSEPSSNSDISGMFKMLWDDANLYVLCEVNDNAIIKYTDIAGQTIASWHNNDAFEIFVDYNNEKMMNYDKNDVQLQFFYGQSNVGGVHQENLIGGNTDGIIYTTWKTPVGINYKIKIPWSKFGTAVPSKGKFIGLEAQLDDIDANVDGRKTSLDWNAIADNAWTTPSVFGTIKLADDNFTCSISKNAESLTVIESVVAESREWKYTTTKGIGYKSFVPSETGTTLNPSYLAAGTYYIICESKVQGTIVPSNEITYVANGLNITFTATNPTCGMSNGSITASVSGGTSPYKYVWSSGDQKNKASDLGSGIYKVTVIDANNLTNFSSYTLKDDGAPTISSVIKNVSCYDGNDGSVTLTVSGGTTPYQFKWSNAATTQSINGITSGTYELTLTDAKKCQVTSSFSISEPSPMYITTSVINSQCSKSNGLLKASVTGGTPNYTYSWTGGGTDSIKDNVAAGAYSLTIKDAKQCSKTFNLIVSDIGGPKIVIDSIKNTSNGLSSGAIYVTPTGGSFPYKSTLWSNQSTSQDLTAVPEGYYTVSIVDGANCKAIAAASVLNKLSKPSICVVTVDTVSGDNLVCWYNPLNGMTDHFNVYREGGLRNQYQLVGTVAGTDDGLFIDKGANPLQKAWTYRISSVDAKGNESELSDPHTTIHLVVSQAPTGEIGLVWTKYSGVNYDGFDIWRKAENKSWIKSDQISANDIGYYTYTDLSAPKGINKYFISVVLPGTCYTRKTLKAGAGPFAAAVSNMEDNSRIKFSNPTEAVEKSDLDVDAKVYPNPFADKIMVSYTINSISDVNISLTDMSGREFERISRSSQICGLYNLELGQNVNPGSYLLKISIGNKSNIIRVVKY